jgi:hypothetical protein
MTTLTIDEIYKDSNLLSQTSEIFRDEVLEYISENFISILNCSVHDKGSIIELHIEAEGNHSYYFNYNKSNGDYAVERSTQI